MIYSAGELIPSITMNSYLKIALSVCIAATVLTAGMIVYAFAKGPGEQGIIDEDTLTSFSSYDELVNFLKDSPSYEGASAFYRLDSGVAPTYSGGESTGSAPEYSTTNVQVAGIDESDIVKTDGEYIYIASYRSVSIVRAYPPQELANVTVLDLVDILGYEAVNTSAYISGIYLFEDRLVVVMSVYEHIPWYWYYDTTNYERYVISMWTSQRAMVSVFDVSDASNPALEFSYGVSGYELTSRMIDSNVYLVAQSSLWVLEESVYLPLLWTGAESTEFEVGRISYDPGTVDSSSFINLLAVDVLTGDLEYKSVVGGYASVVYMSYDALYLTVQKWQGGIILVGASEAPEEEWTTRTSIYKMAVEGLSMATAAKGGVKGWLLNQFSMDEHDGYLRVATTTSWVEPRNAVYVLDSDLAVVGALEGLAPTERIFSARFLGDTLYLVTFRLIDPLFVIDLSDPASPRVLGELKIPGFSSYLHPVGRDHVLGIGYENGSVKITLFNVSDPVRPVEQSTYLVGEYSWTTAAYDHKAVLFDLERALLVLPMTVYGYDEDRSYTYWSGAYVFELTVEHGIVLRGTVANDEVSEYDWVMRALYIGDSLYTISYYVVKASSLVDLLEEGVLIYADVPDYYYTTYSEAVADV